MKRFNVTRCFLSYGAVVIAGGLSVAVAATPRSLGAPELDDAMPSSEIRVGAVRPLNVDEDSAVLRGNPIWSIPLSVLSATRERPIFSASRRPPARAVVAPSNVQVTMPAAERATEVERPALALIGTVVGGDGDAVAVFLNRTDQSILRLRPGDINGGWSVDTVARGEVILTRASRAEAFMLQLPDTSQGSAIARQR
ncbi:MAG: hypothetical protein ACJ8EF_22250 [Bradyrhizobium sp.]